MDTQQKYEVTCCANRLDTENHYGSTADVQITYLAKQSSYQKHYISSVKVQIALMFKPPSHRKALWIRSSIFLAGQTVFTPQVILDHQWKREFVMPPKRPMR